MCRSIATGVGGGDVAFDVAFAVGAPEQHAGVTLEDTRGGVRVKSLHPGDEGAKHLRKGYVIRNVNGFPAVHHRDVVILIDAITASGGMLSFARGHNRSRSMRVLRASAISFHIAHDARNTGHTRTLSNT